MSIKGKGLKSYFAKSLGLIMIPSLLGSMSSASGLPMLETWPLQADRFVVSCLTRAVACRLNLYTIGSVASEMSCDDFDFDRGVLCCAGTGFFPEPPASHALLRCCRLRSDLRFCSSVSRLSEVGFFRQAALTLDFQS